MCVCVCNIWTVYIHRYIYIYTYAYTCTPIKLTIHYVPIAYSRYNEQKKKTLTRRVKKNWLDTDSQMLRKKHVFDEKGKKDTKNAILSFNRDIIPIIKWFLSIIRRNKRKERRWYATICRLAYVGGCAVAHHTLYLSKDMMRTAPVVLAKFILRTIFWIA